MTSCNSCQYLGKILAKIFPRSWQDLAKILLRYPWRVDPGWHSISSQSVRKNWLIILVNFHRLFHLDSTRVNKIALQEHCKTWLVQREWCFCRSWPTPNFSPRYAFHFLEDDVEKLNFSSNEKWTRRDRLNSTRHLRPSGGPSKQREQDLFEKWTTQCKLPSLEKEPSHLNNRPHFLWNPPKKNHASAFE